MDFARCSVEKLQDSWLTDRTQSVWPQARSTWCCDPHAFTTLHAEPILFIRFTCVCVNNPWSKQASWLHCGECFKCARLAVNQRHESVMQGAHDTIETLQTQVLDLEIKISQAKASMSDSQHNSAQDIAKLQEQLRLSELKATSKSDSDSSLRALTAEIAQLRSELQAKVKEAAAAAAASQEAVSAAKVVNLQETLQQAEAQAAANAEAHSKGALTSRELTAAQNRVSQFESSLAEAEEEHKAAMQVGDHKS